MRHHVSASQLVLWSRHEITEAWAPTGIVHPHQADETPDDETKAGRVGAQVKAPLGGDTSALHCAHGRERRGSAARSRVDRRGHALRARIGHSCP